MAVTSRPAFACEDGHVEVMTVEEVDYLLACFWSDALKQLRPEQYDD